MAGLHDSTRGLRAGRDRGRAGGSRHARQRFRVRAHPDRRPRARRGRGHLRIFVGDSEFVRNAASFGVNAGEFGISIGGREELASGDLRAVDIDIDIDIGTAAGFEAYQRFLAEGKLPPAGAPGTRDPITAETVDLSDTAKIEARFGRLKLGGVLGDSEGHIIETRHADGRSRPS